LNARINEKTTVPLLAVICSLPFFVGGIMWLSSVDAKATKGAEAKEMLYIIDKRLDRIEIKLGTKPKEPKEGL
jgi:hypothetical protein